jgi:peptide subunit release factor 1 (eRF1)
VFACEGLKLWRPLFFARPFKDELCADGIPHLGQLTMLAERQRPVIVVVPSVDGAALFEVRLGEVGAEASVHAAVPRSDSENLETGSGQPRRESEREARIERRQEEWARRNRHAAAAEVTLLFDRTPGARVILVGTAETSAAFARELPERVAQAIAAKVPLPRAWTSSGGIRRSGVRELAQAVLGDGADGAERLVERVVGEALRGSVAVVGPDDVVLAVNEGRVHALVVEEDFERRGYLCDNCAALGPDVEAAEVCPFCAGDLRAVQNLREALVARTLAGGGRVEIVPHENRLHSYRGVAAFLRQTAQTGLRGASPPWATTPGPNQS